MLGAQTRAVTEVGEAKGADGVSLSKPRYVGLKKEARIDAIGHPISAASDDATKRGAEGKVCR